jgi:hypothetical protein
MLHTLLCSEGGESTFGGDGLGDLEGFSEDARARRGVGGVGDDAGDEAVGFGEGRGEVLAGYRRVKGGREKKQTRGEEEERKGGRVWQRKMKGGAKGKREKGKRRDSQLNW